MAYKRQYIFGKASNWDSEISDAVDDFKHVLEMNPNILMANSHTFSRLDVLANTRSENIVHKSTGERAKEGKFVGISAFVYSDGELEFCIGDHINDNEYLLIYDDNPEDDGESLLDGEGHTKAA